jgi:hypothetical protein
MNFEGLIDFNKYTLAVAAGSFVYVLEKFVPMQTLPGRLFVLILLCVFLFSALLGVAVFAAATAALHADAARKQRIEAQINRMGIAHAALLCVGLLGLTPILYDRVMSPPKEQRQEACCCPSTAQSLTPASISIVRMRSKWC